MRCGGQLDRAAVPVPGPTARANVARFTPTERSRELELLLAVAEILELELLLDRDGVGPSRDPWWAHDP